MRTLIKNAQVISPADGINEIADIFINGKHIEKIGKLSEQVADFTIDATDMLAIPGLVDIACSLREPGYEYKATIASEVKAAVSAGITSLCCLPATDPTVSTPATVKLIQQRAQESGFKNMYVIGVMTDNLEGKALSEMYALKKAGCIAVTNMMYPFADRRVIKRVLEYATGVGLPVMCYPIDHELIGDGSMHEGYISTQLGLSGISESVETAALGWYLEIVRETGAQVHFCRLSCGRSVEMIADARRKGLVVTADVSIAHLFLTDESVVGYDSNCHVNPPFRSLSDRDALRQGLRDGVLDVVCSDHQPHDLNAKLAPFPSTETGISSIETLLPLILELVHQKVLPLERALAAVTCSAARVAGIDAGRLSQGKMADICIINPDCEWELNEASMLSRGKNTPFIGHTFKAKVSYVISAGEVVYTESHANQ